MNRRRFLSAAAAGVTALVSHRAGCAAAGRLRILILGGTRFLGVHMTELALARGHTVTLFNRGRSNPGLFPGVEQLRGDRDGQLDALAGRKWDAVIDNSGYVPRHVRLSAGLLAPNAGQYLFVSTLSVYPDFAMPKTEDSPLARLEDESIEKVDGQTYGPLKALCERAAEAAMPGRVTVLRPGLIVGPHDGTDRFTCWPARAARGGEMLAPGTPGDRIQIIDVRDLAAFALDLIEKRTTGTYNVVSPPGMFTMGRLVDSSIAAARELARPASPPTATWVPADFLEAQKVSGWTDMPVWLPPSGDTAAFAETSVARALSAGLRVRPLDTTVRDTLAWHLERPEEERGKLRAGISPEREREVLVAWRKTQTRKEA